jgi:lipopolysaccharide export system protein LptA
MVIRSDVLDVLKARSEDGEGQIEKIIARGNVQFENETKRATGKEAVYLANERKVVLTGDARAWEGENEVSGNQMTIFLDEDKSIVESGAGQRVEVYIKSQGNGQSSFVNLGQERTSETEKEASPIFVTADRMEADHEQKTVYFEGKVKTKRADFRMDSDELEVFDSGQDTSRISKIIARGNVRLDRGGKVATGDKAIYYERDRKFLLTGNAKAWESQNIVAGSRMEIYLDEDKSVVLGDGKEQVEVTIYPNEAPTSKQPLPQPSLSVGEKKFD